MKPIKLLILVLITGTSFGQVKIIKVAKESIPAEIHYVGHVIDAIRYADYDGEHLLFTTETGIVKAKKQTSGNDFKNAELYAYNYRITGTQYTAAWKVRDFSGDCDLDVTAKFVPNSLSITDLNKDGKVEVWLMYRTACRGDVSPANMKIIMYEDGKKYAVRGEAKILDGTAPTHYSGGTYSLDNAFKDGPAEFKKYAEELWKKYLIE